MSDVTVGLSALLDRHGKVGLRLSFGSSAQEVADLAVEASAKGRVVVLVPNAAIRDQWRALLGESDVEIARWAIGRDAPYSKGVVLLVVDEHYPEQWPRLRRVAAAFASPFLSISRGMPFVPDVEAVVSLGADGLDAGEVVAA